MSSKTDSIRDNQIYHRIQIGDVAIVEKVDDNTESINYTLRDHLGSLIATFSESGTTKRLFYDPWGKRLDLPVLEAQLITLFDLANFLTPRGFTGHEHLDNVSLIHMNGRVYDPVIARFVSADPFIQDPTYLQSFNRYSYTWNNPLRYTDPSGFYNVQGDSDHASLDRDQQDHHRNNDRDGNDHDNNSRSSNNKSGSGSSATKEADGYFRLSEIAVSAPRNDDRDRSGGDRNKSNNESNKITAQKVVNTLSTIATYSAYAATVSLFVGPAGVPAATFFGTIAVLRGALAIGVDIAVSGEINETAAMGAALSAGYKIAGDKLPNMLPEMARMPARITIDAMSQVQGYLMNEAAKNEERDQY